MRRLGIWAIVVFALDQASKYAVVYGLDLRTRLEIDILPPLLQLRMAWNRGVNFGLFAHDAEVMRWVLIGVALAISGWVIWWIRAERPRALAEISAGVLVGGALGNALDRAVQGAVMDFLNMSCCGIRNPYAFNVADVAIFAGAAGLILFTGRKNTP